MTRIRESDLELNVAREQDKKWVQPASKYIFHLRKQLFINPHNVACSFCKQGKLLWSIPFVLQPQTTHDRVHVVSTWCGCAAVLWPCVYVIEREQTLQKPSLFVVLRSNV